MPEDFAVVGVRANTNVWHEPPEDATPENPVPKCAGQFAADTTWDSWRREIAEDWYTKCEYCSGDYEGSTGQPSLPSGKKVAGDD
jgi:hypothetical protein